ncbi:MAG: SDR family NAD(P)-dependent oxidoreductase [Deltaproteobacteria bacterium]|nr:SDR family NAD(P)-dependent oxidoreductase [Deltaproteobacteria bacterium]
MSKKLPPRARCAVTGAGDGFGRAVALELGARGARVLVSDIDEARAKETAELLGKRGVESHAMRVDVSDPDAVGAMAERMDELWGGADVLVNNAGIAVVGEFAKIPLEKWKLQIDINLNGVIYGCHHFVPRLQKAGGGYILNVASSAGLLSAPMMSPYNVTKAGVVALSETLYAELAPSKIHVTALCPTFFRTNIHTRKHAFGGGSDKATDKLVTESKWSAEEIAKHAIDGLLSNTLYVIPQLDGKVMWHTKRALGQRFYRGLGYLIQSGLLEKARTSGR